MLSVSRRRQNVVAQDFSLPSSPNPRALFNPYDDDNTSDADSYNIASTNVNADADTKIEKGGWLAMQTQAQQRAMAPYLAAAERARSGDALSRAKAELVRMATEAGASDKKSRSALTAAPVVAASTTVALTAAPPATTNLGVVASATGTIAGSPSVAPVEQPRKVSFLKRCTKTLAKKSAFWKK